MASEQLTSQSLYIQLAERIQARIINGEFQVGDRLPSELELAAQYGVSRTIVREGMKVLKERGCVDVKVGRGTFIVDNATRGVGSSFDVIVRKNRDRGFDYLIELREILEPEIAALAALRASAPQVEAMHQAVEMMVSGLIPEGLTENFLKGDTQFHRLMAESCGNPLILSVISPVMDLMREQQEFLAFKVKGGSQHSQVNHRLLFEAIQNHDSKNARRYMLEHIRQVRQDVADNFDYTARTTETNNNSQEK